MGCGSKSSGLDVAQTLLVAGRDAQIPGGGGETPVAEQQLNRPDIGPRFEEVNGKRVSVIPYAE